MEKEASSPGSAGMTIPVDARAATMRDVEAQQQRHSLTLSPATSSGVDNGKSHAPLKKVGNGDQSLTVDEQQLVEAGEERYHKLSWRKLTICLIVEAVALGTLSMPKVFATLGMVAGMIITVGLGLIAIYTSWIIGQVKLRFPHIQHYTDAGALMFGRVGWWLIAIMFVAQLTLSTGSHALTGTIAFDTLASDSVCSLAFGAVSAVILFIFALPPTFSEMAILGYIDFASIIVAVLVTIIAVGIRAGNEAGGLDAVDWSAWPKENIQFSEAFVQVSNVVFAYSFAFCQFSFMDEMRTPEDYVKSIWTLGIVEIIIYSLSGALIYAFVGVDVQSPALLSAGPTMAKVVFGLALPVIFISGSINTTVAARFIHSRLFRNDVTVRYINNAKGWLIWSLLVALITVIAWVIAESIPFFSDLLAVMSSLFISGFTFYFPALMWFMLLKEGKWYATRHNLVMTAANAAVGIIGLVVLGCGTYASIKDIIDTYNNGSVRSPFTCAPL